MHRHVTVRCQYHHYYVFLNEDSVMKRRISPVVFFPDINYFLAECTKSLQKLIYCC